MERFVRLIVGGGIALVVGLWSMTGFAWGTAPWGAGVLVAVLGGVALGAGIWSELEV